jgi:molybdopterin synthase sulfur carrier subunit
MGITVKFIGALRHVSGGNSQIIDCAECSVRELIGKISGSSPDLKRDLLGGEGENVRPNSLVLVNGREISVLDGLDTVLKDDDEVVFIPVVHGG